MLIVDMLTVGAGLGVAEGTSTTLWACEDLDKVAARKNKDVESKPFRRPTHPKAIFPGRDYSPRGVSDELSEAAGPLRREGAATRRKKKERGKGRE